MRHILFGLFALALAAPVAAQTEAIRTAVTTDLPDNMTGEISAADMRGVLLSILDVIDGLPTTADIEQRISPFARVPPAGTVPLTAVPNLPAARITSGVFAAARIPDLGAGRVTSGVFDEARIPNLPATRVTSGVFDVGRIPSIPASRIASGTLPAARIGALPAGQITTGTFALARLPAQLARIPVADCSNGQVWKRGASTWACAADETATGGTGLDAAGVRNEVNTMLLTGTNIGLTRTGSGASRTVTIGLTGTVAFGNLPFVDCANGQLPIRGSTAWGCETTTVRQTIIDSRISPAARATPTGSFAAAQIPNLPASRITTGQIPAARIGALPASQITTGTLALARIPSLPAGQITSGTLGLARIPTEITRDAEIETWAIIASTGASAIVPATVIDNALTRDAEIPSVLFAGAAGWDRAAAGECLRVVAGTTTATRTSFDWEPCPTGGGGGATVAYLFDALDSDLAVDTPETDDTWTEWNDVATLAAITTDVGRSLLICHVDGIAGHTPGADNANSGGDRLMHEIRIVEGTGANPDVIDTNRVYGPRFGTNFGGANFIAATSRSTTDTVAADLTEAGDVYRCQVRIIAQSTHQRRMTFQANATLLELYQVR